MNEQFKQQLQRLQKTVDGRKQSEKLLVFGLLLAGVFILWLTLVSDPLNSDIDSLRSQITRTERQITSQRESFESMVAASQEDPNQFASQRMREVERELDRLQTQIEQLAGDLVTPNQMTRVLVEVLQQQNDLQMIEFRNQQVRPLNAGTGGQAVSAAGTTGLNSAQEGGQVFEHGLVLEFEGDFFATLRYLQFLERMNESFFWDSIEFQRQDWPSARVTLQIHTLGTDRGFIGV